jgi:hypothetical protein
VIGGLPTRPLQCLHLTCPVAVLDGSEVLHNESTGCSAVGHRHSGRCLVNSVHVGNIISLLQELPYRGSPSPIQSRADPPQRPSCVN